MIQSGARPEDRLDTNRAGPTQSQVVNGENEKSKRIKLLNMRMYPR
jgi:hypothetical protein